MTALDPATAVVTGAAGRRRPVAPAVPAEGVGGLFTQTWYPVCLSREVPAGKVVGADFLGGRVVAFRPAAGPVQVLSAYCVHVGADLAVGSVVDDRLRCGFHGWEYAADGRCVATGIGDPVPPRARLFRFPTVERFGIVWAFNGDEPLFDLPRPAHPEHDLTVRAHSFDQPLPVDPWVVCAQTLDLQHFSLPHEGVFAEDPYGSVTATDHSMGYHFDARMPGGERYDVQVAIHGTNIFWQAGTLYDRWFFWITGLAIPKPGQAVATFAWGARPGQGEDPADVERFLGRVQGFMMNLLVEDTPVLATIHYRPGLLTRRDSALARFFQYLRDYPRSDRSVEFIH